MVGRTKRGVNIVVDTIFFENVFEKERKKMENIIRRNSGIDKRLTQRDFTRIIARNKMKLNRDLFKIEFKNGINKRKKR